jgi:uncharacterized protein YecE (DUF72 family)
MAKREAELYIGTSGWIYGHWQGIFYPEDLPSKDKLRYYSQFFRTVEINYSFYHLPRPKTYQNWYSQTPEDFLFALKASRFITHIKRLKGVKDAWEIFLKNALNLKEKLGPILFQFPPSFRATEENIKRLEKFLKLITNPKRVSNSKLRFAFEFRHQTFCDERIYKILREHKTAWVIADSPRYPKVEVVTTDFVYIRMHGSKAMFSSKYTEGELKALAQKIKRWQGQGLDIYCYFNNDLRGYAIENAKELSEICQGTVPQI